MFFPSKKMALVLFVVIFFSTVVNATEAIGFYSKGEIKNSESIIERGIILHKLFLQRKRFYATRLMNDVISDSSDFVRQRYPDADLLQLGDLANKDGGACKEHSSHQNGLDADIVYLTYQNKLQSQTALYWEEEFVKNGVVTSNFHIERNFELFKFLVMNKPVSRIFVDSAIKKKFCSFAKSRNLLNDKETVETLRKLRVEKLHSTHFHLRLYCPPEDSACQNQPEVPNGSGC